MSGCRSPYTPLHRQLSDAILRRWKGWRHFMMRSRRYMGKQRRRYGR